MVVECLDDASGFSPEREVRLTLFACRKVRFDPASIGLVQSARSVEWDQCVELVMLAHNKSSSSSGNHPFFTYSGDTLSIVGAVCLLIEIRLGGEAR